MSVLGPYCTVSAHAGPLPGVSVIEVAGEIDAAAAEELWPVLREQIDRADRAVVDLTAVTFFGSAGLKLLMDGWQATRDRAAGFAVTAADEQVLKPLQITKLDEIVLVRADVDQAADAALLDQIAPDGAGF